MYMHTENVCVYLFMYESELWLLLSRLQCFQGEDVKMHHVDLESGWNNSRDTKTSWLTSYRYLKL